jgi:hypothetical protein
MLGWEQGLEQKCWRIFKNLGIGEECRIGSKLLFENKHSASDKGLFTYLAVLLVSIPHANEEPQSIALPILS